MTELSTRWSALFVVRDQKIALIIVNTACQCPKALTHNQAKRRKEELLPKIDTDWIILAQLTRLFLYVRVSFAGPSPMQSIFLPSR